MVEEMFVAKEIIMCKFHEFFMSVISPKLRSNDLDTVNSQKFLMEHQICVNS